MKKTKETIRYFLVVGVLVQLFIEAALAQGTTESLVMPDLKEYRIERSISDQAQKCIDCHSELESGIVADWSDSRHAHANITCLDCHGAGAADADVSVKHLELTKTRISAIVSPKDCSRCHPQEASQYSKSKHANTLEIIWKIDPWMREGMNNAIERRTGCYHCHGSVVKVIDGGLDAVVTNYNEVYYKPMKKLIDQLYEQKLLSKEKPLDEKLEIDFYELWHHEGRRARFGAAMMAPDYAWWHGFYELKKRCMTIEEQAEHLLQSKKAAKIFDVKGTGNDTTQPDFDR